MEKQSGLCGTDENAPDHEFADLLAEIEKEPVPERLLALALKLQSAQIEQKRQRPVTETEA